MRYCNLLILLFLLSACHRGEKSAQSGVSYIPVKLTTLERKLNWRGWVRAADRLEIRADKKFKVAKVGAKNFESVKKGQVLLEADRVEMISKRDEAKNKEASGEVQIKMSSAKVEHAQKILHRKKELLAKGIIPRKEFDEALKDFKMSESESKSKELEQQRVKRELSQLEEELKVSNYQAPREGVVSNLPLLGAEVELGQIVAVISNLNQLALWVEVEESHAHQIQAGQPVTIALDIAHGQNFQGKVKEIATSSQQDSMIKTYEVGIAFDAKGIALREGYSGEATLSLFKKENVIAIPIAAIRYIEGKSYALVSSTEGGKFSPRQIQIGLKTDEEVEVLSGLSENEFVVLEGGSV